MLVTGSGSRRVTILPMKLHASEIINKIDFSPRSRWLMGPGFLRTNESEWPSFCGIEEHLGEEKEIRSKRYLLIQKTSLIEFARFSSLSRTIRNFALYLVLSPVAVVKGMKYGGMVSAGELATALSPLGEELKSVGKRYSHAYLYELFTWNWLMIYRLYWKLWVVEFLPTMTRRVKWCEQASPMKERDVVFICD